MLTVGISHLRSIDWSWEGGHGSPLPVAGMDLACGVTISNPSLAVGFKCRLGEKHKLLV